MNTCNVGLVGAGVVGGGVAETILTRGDLLAARSGVRLQLVKVAEKDAPRARSAGVPESILVDDYRKVIADPKVDIVVELVGGTGIANEVVSGALDAGKHVVTANKALLAEKGRPLFAKAKEKGLVLAFEASVAGGIPLILALRDGLLANRTRSLHGIVNGTCNYILSEMAQKGLSFEHCLAEAQKLGFAEANPSTDIDGIDTGHKLAILAALVFETWMDFPALHIEGIRNVKDMDVRVARELGYTLKLLAVARPEPEPKNAADGGNGSVPPGSKLFLSVHPALLRHSNPLASVNGSMNAVELMGDVVGESMFYGRGAGRFPTASAIVSDIVAIARARSANHAPPSWFPPEKNAYVPASMDDYLTRYYLRLTVQDRPGVLGKLTTVLGSHGVSIATVRQLEHEVEEGTAPVCVLTHQAREGAVKAALEEIAKMDFLRGEPVLLRIEG